VSFSFPLPVAVPVLIRHMLLFMASEPPPGERVGGSGRQ